MLLPTTRRTGRERGNRRWRGIRVVAWLSLVGGLLGSCKGGGKQEIPLSGDQTYLLASSGKLTVFASAATEGAGKSLPLNKLRVKRKNDGAAAKTPGCWACTDCICNGDDCACTECTSC
jgi:hypothetical protein